MVKEYTATIIIIAFFSIAIYFTIDTKPLNYRVEKVRIDSVSVKDKYSFLPDKTWTYYTKYGATISSNSEVYKVGDSIDVKIVKVNQ